MNCPHPSVQRSTPHPARGKGNGPQATSESIHINQFTGKYRSRKKTKISSRKGLKYKHIYSPAGPVAIRENQLTSFPHSHVVTTTGDGVWGGGDLYNVIKGLQTRTLSTTPFASLQILQMFSPSQDSPNAHGHCVLGEIPLQLDMLLCQFQKV